MHRFLPVWTALLLASVACSADGYGNAATFPSTQSPTNGTTISTGDTGNPTLVNSPEFFALTGSLAIDRGDLDPYSATVEMDFRNADAETICLRTRTMVAATTVVNTDPDLPLYGWWNLELDGYPPPDCAFGADRLKLGIGAWDLQLDAAATSQNLDGANLYALYVQPEASSVVYVFGASGTAEQFSGTTPPVDAAPLPDGVYQLRTLYLLPVEP